MLPQLARGGQAYKDSAVHDLPLHSDDSASLQRHCWCALAGPGQWQPGGRCDPIILHVHIVLLQQWIGNGLLKAVKLIDDSIGWQKLKGRRLALHSVYFVILRVEALQSDRLHIPPHSLCIMECAASQCHTGQHFPRC